MTPNSWHSISLTKCGFWKCRSCVLVKTKAPERNRKEWCGKIMLCNKITTKHWHQTNQKPKHHNGTKWSLKSQPTLFKETDTIFYMFHKTDMFCCLVTDFISHSITDNQPNVLKEHSMVIEPFFFIATTTINQR